MKYEQTNYDNNYVTNERYYETKTRKPLSYYIIRFLIGLILLALLLFLLMSIFPTKSGIKSTIENAINNSLGNTLEEKLDATLDKKLSPLYDRIFGDNIVNMKNTAKDYFTTARMPKNEGDTVKLTLGEMIEKKLITPIKDKNGKMCDTEKSYVEVTKVGDEYKMKVNLSCDGEEDYTITYLGCYNYCKGDICESKATAKTVATKTTTTKTTPKKVEKHYCVYYNGKYYDKSGNVVSKTAYEKACTQKPVEKHYCVY